MRKWLNRVFWRLMAYGLSKPEAKAAAFAAWRAWLEASGTPPPDIAELLYKMERKLEGKE